MIQDTGISQESYNENSSILELWCYWRTDKLNRVLIHLKQIYKPINTDIQAN